jgi:hypothetical protein
MGRVRKGLLLAIAVIGFGSVALQLCLTLTSHPDHTVLWRLIDFLSYFTNTTAILATGVSILALVRPASRLAQPGAITATAVYILVVAVTYQLLLSGETHGLDFLTNLGLHQVLPAMVIVLWAGFTPKAHLRWREPLAWTLYPAAYIAWTLARGAVIHRYPYFFADVDKLGYPRTLANGAGFLAAFYALGVGAVALGQIGPRLRPSGRPGASSTEQAVYRGSSASS